MLSQNFGKSIRGRFWSLLEAPERDVLHLSQNLGLSDVLARILINRGVTTLQDAKTSLSPRLSSLLPNPYLLKDMDKAVARMVNAIENNEKITIFADYDVDGATSSALLYKVFKHFGTIPNIYVPHRLLDGYGPTVKSIDKIAATKTDLLITVDCGTAAYDAVNYAKKLGIDVIVVDHHLASKKMPDAYAIINPNRLDDDFPYNNIAAVSVAFFVVIALRSAMRSSGKQAEIDLMPLLDLVALGTVCDVMPLTPFNRALIMHGINSIWRKNNLGLSVMLESLKIESSIDVYHLGYVIGPRINAGGRAGRSDLGARLLTTEDYVEAKKIANELELLNNERKAIEHSIMEKAILKIEGTANDKSVILSCGEDWHIGILGILASRIKERYNKPSIVISMGDNGVCKGSGRSISGIDLGTLISNARNSGLLIDGGGHPMAGGFSIQKDKIAEFEQYLLKEVSKINNLNDVLLKVHELKIDAIVKTNAISKKLFSDINKASPFGNGNPMPRFVLLNVRVVSVMEVRKTHVSIIVVDNVGKSRSLRCMLFKSYDSEVGQFLLKSDGKIINLAGTIRNSNNNPNQVDFIIDDVSIWE